jgi:glycolate oxidase
MTDLLAELRAALPDGAVIVDPHRLESYRRDEARQVEGGMPALAVLPASTAEVSAVLAAASRHLTPVVPRGAGTGLSGGAAAVDGCIVLSTTRMTRVVDVQADEQYAVVQPGVITADVDAAAVRHGLWYPPDPSSWRECTIGGNVATDAGGLCCVRYGTTSDHVLGLEVVLASGEVLRTGRRTAKGVAGYDLTSLIVGSEGTLGIVTEATLRLRPRRPVPATAVAMFGTLAAAGEAVLALLRARLAVSLLEIMDRTTIAAVDQLGRMGLDTAAAALVFVQTEAPEERVTIEEICRQAGAKEVHTTADVAESELLLQARRLALPALQQLGSVLLDDVAVPRSRVPALIERVEQAARRRPAQGRLARDGGRGCVHPGAASGEGCPGPERPDEPRRGAGRTQRGET